MYLAHALSWLTRQAMAAFTFPLANCQCRPRYSTPLFGLVSAQLFGIPVTTGVPASVMVHKASGILIYGGGIVLLKRQAPSFGKDGCGNGSMDTWWEVPGGKPNYNNEPIKDVVAREMAEEIGAIISVKECLGVATHPKFPDQVIAYYKCEYGSGTIGNKLPEEHTGLKIFSPEELAKLIETDEVRVPAEILEDFIRNRTITLRPPVLPFGLSTFPVLG